MALHYFGYLHMLLFRCKQCSEPVTVPVEKQEGNLEEVDGDTYDVKCRCGWSESLLGAGASAHWVVPWEQRKDDRRLLYPTDEIRFSN
jgi:hypothetical protein